MQSAEKNFGSAISNGEFAQFQRLIFRLAGITLPDTKKVLVVGRLSRRMSELGMNSFGQYYRYIESDTTGKEPQMVVDLLTTNETYFFRESKHFDFLREISLSRRSVVNPFRVWSAASSSGEEAYSIAMVLADTRSDNKWQVVGSDISSRVLVKASNGHYSTERADGIPPEYLKKYCLKGVGKYGGTLLIDRLIRSRVEFLQNNLMSPRKDLGMFDVIFLRNVMIYFDNDTKKKVVSNLLPFLKEDGYFIVGHSETLSGLTSSLEVLRPTIYRKI